MTTFAQYPELPDEDNPAQDGGEIGATTQTSAPAGPGQPKPTTTAPTSSGLTQNFGAFQAANRSKLDALKNLTLDRVQGEVESKGQAFQQDVGKEVSNLGAKQATFNWGSLNKDSDLSGIGAALTTQKADPNSGVGNLAGGASFNDYRTAAERAAGLNSKAGTTNALMQGGTNAANAAQDSLLLQANSDYRKGAQTAADKNKGIHQTALDNARNTLVGKASEVDTANAGYVKQGKEKLGALRSELDTDLTARAQQATQENRRAAERQTSMNERQILQAIRSADPATIGGMVDPDMQSFREAITMQAANVSQQHMPELLKLAGINPANFVKTISPTSNTVSADQVYAADPKRQAQIAALNAIMEGSNYNSAATMGPAMSEVDSGAMKALQDQILAAVVKRATDKYRNKAPAGAGADDHGDARESGRTVPTSTRLY